MFSIDDIGTVSFVQRDNQDGARKEKENGVASVVQSTSGDSGGVEANEANLTLMAEATLKIDDESSHSRDDANVTSANTPKQTAKKK